MFDKGKTDKIRRKGTKRKRLQGSFYYSTLTLPCGTSEHILREERVRSAIMRSIDSLEGDGYVQMQRTRDGTVELLVCSPKRSVCQSVAKDMCTAIGACTAIVDDDR